MEAYRDQYATLFNNGRNVVVIAISVDADTTLASWAKEQDFPMLFLSDAQGQAGQLYGARAQNNRTDDRSLFVIRPDGRVGYVTRPFRVLTPGAYTELGAVVDSLSPPPSGGG
jgi:peroxiredoxin